MWLNRLAVQKCLDEDLASAGEITQAQQAEIKKGLQAEVVIHGFGSAWSELVDEIFPGQGLEADDDDRLQEELVRAEESRQAFTDESRKTLDEMIKFLDEPLTSETYAALHLASLLCAKERLLQQLSGMTPRVGSIEDMRVFLIEQGLNGARWMELIDRFFG